MAKTRDIKAMIIENFIDHYTTNKTERKEMKASVESYVKEDHVDEIEQAYPCTSIYNKG